MGTILLVVLVLLLLGAFPRWNYSKNWGYGPSGILGVILIVVVVLLVDRSTLSRPGPKRLRAGLRRAARPGARSASSSAS